MVLPTYIYICLATRIPGHWFLDCRSGPQGVLGTGVYQGPAPRPARREFRALVYTRVRPLALRHGVLGTGVYQGPAPPPGCAQVSNFSHVCLTLCTSKNSMKVNTLVNSPKTSKDEPQGAPQVRFLSILDVILVSWFNEILAVGSAKTRFKAIVKKRKIGSDRQLQITFETMNSRN